MLVKSEQFVEKSKTHSRVIKERTAISLRSAARAPAAPSPPLRAARSQRPPPAPLARLRRPLPPPPPQPPRPAGGAGGGGWGEEEEEEEAGPGAVEGQLWRGGITAGGILNSPPLLVMVFKCIVLLSEQRKSLRGQSLLQTVTDTIPHTSNPKSTIKLSLEREVFKETSFVPINNVHSRVQKWSQGEGPPYLNVIAKAGIVSSVRIAVPLVKQKAVRSTVTPVIHLD
ncbi:uncharacterized protein ACIBXB_021522 [Morphnus guianensis]